MQEEKFTAPKDSKEILDHISNLTFKQRLQYGADIGRKCENADDLIKQLRDNPPPAVPNVELDEGLCKILEPQQRNVSKYYHQHQIALTAAVSSKKHLDLLRDEVKSQSKFFKKYVIKHYIKQQPNDEEIATLVKSVAPSVQKKIIHCLIKEKRTVALDILCEEMRKIAGIDFMVDFLHGCSSTKVRESLDFKNIFQHKSLRWDKLFRFHQAMLIKMISDQLSAATLTWGRYNAIYTIWTKRDKDSKYKKNRLSAWEEMLQTGTYQSKALWELVLTYPHAVIDPCLTYKEKKEFEKEIAANGHELKTFNDIRIKKIVPDFVRDRFNYFTRRNPDLFLKFVIETTVINLRGVIRHSIPGKLWCQKDFKPQYIFEILKIAKGKSNRKLLWPYHELVNRRNMSKWQYNIYTNGVEDVCKLQYGSKLKNKVGFDHLLLCQITRAKTKKSVFYSFSPRQMSDLINYVYDWMEEMKPRGMESDLYDDMGWIELLNQWNVNWLSKLYTKRNKKEGTNRYDDCIALLNTRWIKLWDKLTSNEWRQSFESRMRSLETLARDVYDALDWWRLKCDHESRKEATHRETQFAKTLQNLTDRVRKGGVHYGTDKINKLLNGVGNARSGFLQQFNSYRSSITILPSKVYTYFGSRQWPLKSQLESLYELILTVIRQEAHAQFAFDYFVSFHVLRNVRKMRCKQRYQVLNNLLQILYERRPVYYAITPNDIIYSTSRSSEIRVIMKNRLSEWLDLYEQIMSEIWDEALHKKRVTTEYGWRLAKSTMNEYMVAYQFIIQQNERVSTDISHWFYSQTSRQRFGFFRAGGSNSSFAKKPFYAPSIVRSILGFIKNRRINRRDVDQIVPLTLIKEMYDYYLEMIERIKPPSSRHSMYGEWIRIVERSQRLLIQDLQTYLGEKQCDIELWDREPASEEEKDVDVALIDDEGDVGDIVVTGSRDRATVGPRSRPGGDRGGGRRGRPGRGRGRGRGTTRDKHYIQPKSDPIKAAKRKQRLMRDIVMSGIQHRQLTREGVAFVSDLFPPSFDALLEFYRTATRVNWDNDRKAYERIWNVLDVWNKAQPTTKAEKVSRRWVSMDRKHNQWLRRLDTALNCSTIAPKQESKLLQIATEFGGNECNSADGAMKVKLPKLHADNEKSLSRLRDKAYSNWKNHIERCAEKDREWLSNMMEMTGLFSQYQYSYIYRIFKEFVAVFEVTQFWSTKEYLAILIDHWSRKHLLTMQAFAKTLSKTVNRLDVSRESKIDLLKQIRHKKTKDNMDIDGEEKTNEMKDGTYESREITKVNGWISEMIIKCFALELRETPKEWAWSPDLFYLFEYVILFAPNDDFGNLFSKLNKAIVDAMKKDGNTALLQLLIRRLKSKMRCAHDANWMSLWECFCTMRSKLENKFDDYGCDLMINECTRSKQREIIFAEIATEDHLKILCNQRPAVFVKLFGALCDFPNRTSDVSRQLANGFLGYFLAEDELNASPDTKDQLLRYLDVRDHKIRKRLAKLTDSNSVDEREAGYRTLITATLLVNSVERDVQMKRTVKFFMTKLKNEAIDRREMGLEILFGELKSQNSLILESDDCLRFLTEMLQDCLEVQDLDKGEDSCEWHNIAEHRILRHFLELSVDAIELAANTDLDGTLFEFGVDLQWRMCVFRKGNTDAAKEFRINLGPNLVKRHKVLKQYLSHMERYGTEEGQVFDGIFFYEDEEALFVEKYMAAYEARTGIYYAEYLDSSVTATSFMENLFLVLGCNWHKSVVLQDLLLKLVTDFEDLDLVLDEEGGDGLQLVASAKDIEAATAKIICYIVEFNGDEWIDIAVMARFVNALFGAFRVLHSEGHDDILILTQKTLVFMLDALLFEYTKDAKARRAYKDDWAEHKILKLLIDHCMDMLSVKYPLKSNGRFWRMQWELHKVFRSRMMKCDQDIETILHIDDVNTLPTFKWTLFGNYWQVCLDGLSHAVNHMTPEKEKEEDDEDEEKALELSTAKEKKGHKERVISLFRNDEERDIWRLELAVWCVDMATQWVWGGDWLEIAQSPVALLMQNSSDWRGFMIIPTQTLFSTVSKPILRFRWNECSIVRSVFALVLRSLVLIDDVDMEGLRVFEKQHPAVVIFEKLITKYHTNRSRNIKMNKDYAQYWYEMDLTKEYMDVTMHSRQINIVLWRWWAHHSTNEIVKKNGRKTVTTYVKSIKKRTIAINTLLSITSSAIYLRFVWRHLLQHNQHKLSSFLESGSCFRGVFYLAPDDRKYTRKQQRDRASRKAQMAARYAEAETKTDRVLGASGALKKSDIATRDQRRGGGKDATRRILSVQAAKRKETPDIVVELSAMEQVQKEFVEQERFETAFEEWKNAEDKVENDVFDHRDVWCFEGCYQLNRLLPHQLSSIGQRHVAAAMNTNRGMPERVKSIIRWTLLPTTTYADIVQFFNEHKSEKLPINLLEALMKGVMENDEVLAPMHYLLQPEFLSSQQARIAAFAIAKCVPHIPRRQYTNLLRAVLSGKRRNALKVTAYKQIIRMLIEKPSRTHIQMVVHEWDRNEVHRDVRIVILQAAFDFIRRAKAISYGSDAAWHIFETAVTHPVIRKNIEIMTALMGCTIEGQERDDDIYKGLVLTPRLLDHLQCFKETPIPKKHAARWAKIIVVLCDRVYTEYVDPTEEKEEGEGDGDGDGDTKMDDEDEDVDVDMEIEETKQEEDDGAYLKNKGKPRCLDDIAYMAMRSLEMWTKYNDSIVRDALRIVGETITDFNIDFIAAENEDIHKVNWNRFEMCCDILKKTLKLSQSNIRQEYIPIITDIVGRFDAVINSSLQRFTDVYGYGESSTFTISDEFAQSRDYISRVRKRLYKFFDLMASFKQIPIEYYKSVIAPLDSGSSQGMYTDIVMNKRWEMLSNDSTRSSAQYFTLCIDFICDVLYYGCLDANFANDKVMTNTSNILATLSEKDKGNLLKMLMQNQVPNNALYDAQIVSSTQYHHLRHCMIKHVISNRLIGSTGITQLGYHVFCEYFTLRIKLLVDCIGGPATHSFWRKSDLTHTQIEVELRDWLSFVLQRCSVLTNYQKDATLHMAGLAQMFFGKICKRADALMKGKGGKYLCIEDWLYIKLFHHLCCNNMGVLVVLYGSRLCELIKMPIVLAEKEFVRNKRNPFGVDGLSVEQILHKMWGHITSSYFYKSWNDKRYALIAQIFKWLLSPSRSEEKQKWRRNVVDCAVACLKQSQYQSKSWEITKNKFVVVFDAIRKEKCTLYHDDKDKDRGMETDPILLGKVAVEMHDILRAELQFVGSLIDASFGKFNPLFNEILWRSERESDIIHKRILLRLMVNNAYRCVFFLHDKLQKVFDLAIEFTVNPPRDGLGGLTCGNISKLIEQICHELSPKWRSHEKLNGQAIKLICALFNSFINTRLQQECDLEAKAKVYRNVCIYLLQNEVNLVQIGLHNKLASSLKYLIDLNQAHLNFTSRNPKNICFSQCAPRLSLSRLLQRHFEALNHRYKYTKTRTVDPICGALICQIYKDAADCKSLNHEICGAILFEFMNNCVSLITQAIYSDDLVKMVSWSIDYVSSKSLSFANINKFIHSSSSHLSPTFSTKRVIAPLAAQYYKLLIVNYCDWSSKNIYSKRVETITSILKSIINNESSIKWLVCVCAKQSMNLIYALTLQYTLSNLDGASKLIFKYICAIESESRNKYWKRINIDDYTNYTNYIANIDDDDYKAPISKKKKTKLCVDEMYKTNTHFMPETLQIIHKIFQKKLIHPTPTKETKNTIWNEFMIGLMVEIMDRYGDRLMTILEITNTFVVSFISYISKTPLRYRGALKSKLISYFKANSIAQDERDEAMQKWVEWMLNYRKEMNRSSRDIMTRLALSLIVHFGHESCKKSKRIQYEMSEKERAETKEDDDDKDSDDDDDDESDTSFESEADDVITWQAQWVQLLNEFSNDKNAVIRMTTRRVKTVFVDWEEHKAATTSWVKRIVDNDI